MSVSTWEYRTRPHRPGITHDGPDVRAEPEWPGQLDSPFLQAVVGYFESIVWDYPTTDHSPRGHPLAHLRPQIAVQGLPDTATVQRMRRQS